MHTWLPASSTIMHITRGVSCKRPPPPCRYLIWQGKTRCFAQAVLHNLQSDVSVIQIASVPYMHARRSQSSVGHNACSSRPATAAVTASLSSCSPASLLSRRARVKSAISLRMVLLLPAAGTRRFLKVHGSQDCCMTYNRAQGRKQHVGSRTCCQPMRSNCQRFEV